MYRVTLGKDLRSRLIGYFVHSCRSPYSDAYVNELGEASGQNVEASHVFRGPTGLPYAYTVILANGKVYRVPALFVVEDEPREVRTQ